MTTTLLEDALFWDPATGETTDALAFRSGRIVAHGETARALPVDARSALGGAFVMPAFGDGHAHPLFGGREADGPPVRNGRTVDEVVAIVRDWADAHPHDPWIVGASYDDSLSAEGLFDARLLDAAVPDRPVVLRASDYHTVWCNSEALRVCGIDASTPDPPLGQIPRRNDGSPLGTLREWGATELVLRHVPSASLKDRARAVRRAGSFLASQGITWVQDAWVEEPELETYLEAARSGDLVIRTNLALYADPRRFSDQITWFTDARDRIEDAAHPLLTGHTIKFFADGVIENETGALLEPYCSALHSHGLAVWEGETFAEALRTVDSLGFQIHIHAIGDAAVRNSLDALEALAASSARPANDRRPVIAHAQLIDPADISRFAELGVVVVAQPLWAQLDGLMTVLTIPRIGEFRSAGQYPLRSLAESGAQLAFGSDWPVSSPNPLWGIATAVSRQTAHGDPVGGWIPGEKLSIERALTAYSAGVAYPAFADRAEAPWGSLAVGSSADLVVLDADPRFLTAEQIRNVAVLQTYLRGQALL